MWDWQRRARTWKPILDVEIQVVTVGDVAFVRYPAVYFTDFGLRTKSKSPLRNAFVVELANGWQLHAHVGGPRARRL